MPLLALSGSSSSRSINRRLLEYAVTLASEPVELVSVIDIEAPMFSVDREEAEGVPADVVALAAKIAAADGLILATPEHNGGPPAMLKNVIDWLSRVKQPTKFMAGPLLLIGTSPGGRGARTVLDTLAAKSPHWGAEPVEVFSLPSFNQSFDGEANQPVDEAHREQLAGLVAAMEAAGQAVTPPA